MLEIVAPEIQPFLHYLPIPDAIFHSGLYVTSAGQRQIRAGEAYPPAVHPPLYQFKWAQGRILPEFALILITAGKGRFESRPTGPVPVSKGMAILLFPGVWHRYHPEPSTGWTEKWVQFNGELAHLFWAQKVLLPETAVLHPSKFGLAEAAMDHLLAEVHANTASNSLLCSLRAMSALSLAVDALANDTAPAEAQLSRKPQDPAVAAALEVIWTCSHQFLSVQNVADQLHVNRRTLERRVRAALGHSLLDEIVRCRFNRAERLLRETELPIKTVASLAGFGTSENMRQIFLKRAKISPAGYRRASSVRL